MGNNEIFQLKNFKFYKIALFGPYHKGPFQLLQLKFNIHYEKYL
jgi:hypothetical protein